MLIAVAGAAGYIAVTAFRPAPVSVETSRVSYGPMQVTIDAEGRTRVRDRFVVAAPVAGRLTRSTLRRGDLVAKGAVVARITPPPITPLNPQQQAEARARVAAAEQLRNEADAMVEQARADYEQAEREFARAERLVETGDIARQEFERARNAMRTGRQQLEAARFKARAAAAEVEVAKAALLAIEQAGQSGEAATVAVHAPVGGRILQLLEESERVVAAGTPLMELGNVGNSALEIVIDVLSSDAVRIEPGAMVLIEGWGGEQPLRGRVRMIEPSAFTKVSALGIEEQRVNVIADFLDPPGALGDGYRVEARIVIWESEGVVKAPASALFRNGKNWSVFVVEKEIARSRDVAIGHRTPFEVEIVSGLEVGERLILHPSTLVADGSAVESNDIDAPATED